jgi:recombination protein RecA
MGEAKKMSKDGLTKLQKAFGKGSIMQLSDGAIEGVERISSGSLYLDSILGGGWPLGRIIEIYGQESSGKSSTCLHLLAEAQKAGLVCGYVDMEMSFDPIYAKQLGVDTGPLLLSQPSNGEEAIDITKAMVESGEIQVVIVDSTSTLVPKSEIEGEAADHAVGLQARLLSKAMRMLNPLTPKHNCLIVFISQMREKIGVTFGDPRTIGVGNAMKFYASIRVEVSKTTPAKDENGIPIGHTMKFQTKKNKTYPPFKKSEVFFRYGEGFDRLSEIVDLASQMDIIKRAGSWYSYGDTKLGQGAEKVIELLKDNPTLSEELEAKVIEGLKAQ